MSSFGLNKEKYFAKFRKSLAFLLSRYPSKKSRNTSRGKVSALRPLLGRKYKGRVGQDNSGSRVLYPLSQGSGKNICSKENYPSQAATWGALGRDKSNASKRCNRASRSQEDSRVLLHFLSSAQERWRAETSSELESFKQICSDQDFQNADGTVGDKPSSSRRLAGFVGLERCLLSCPDQTRPQILSPIRVSRTGFPVQGPALRPRNSSSGVYQGTGSGNRFASYERDSCIPLSRRLSHGGKDKASIDSSYSSLPASTDECRFCDQFQEVCSHPRSETEIPRYRFRFSEGEGLSARGQSSSISPLRSFFHDSRRVPSSASFPASSRSDGSVAAYSPACQALYEANPIVPQQQKGYTEPGSAVASNGSGGIVTSHTVVDDNYQSYSGSTLEISETIGDSDHRCIARPLGRSPRGLQGSAQMESAPENSPYQYSRAAGSSESLSGFSAQTSGKVGVSTNRQLHSPDLYKQSRRDEVTSAMPDNMGHPQLVYSAQNPVAGCSYSRETQSVGRQVVSDIAVAHRVGAQRSRNREAVSSMEQAYDRSVRYTFQQETPEILLPVPSSSGGTSRRLVDELGQSVCLRLSSDSHSQSGLTQGGKGEDDHDFDSSALVQEGVVSSPPGSDHRFSLSPSSLERSGDAGGGNSSPCQSRRALSGGMVNKRNKLISRGLSKAAADTCIAAKSTGTQKNYQSGWNCFCTWCAERDIDPNESSVPTIVDYLQCLLEVKGKSFHTARARVSAISFFHPGHTFRGSLGSHDLIQSFVSGARRRFPPLRDKLPSWDLPTVLKAMMHHPYEPIQDLSLGQLTHKTLFLVAICSARRIGELKALDCRPPYCSIGLGGVVLKTHESFRTKVPTLANLEKSVEFAPFGLAQDGSELPERALCVCRALQFYVAATADVRKTNQLFVTFKKGDQGRAASKITMAGWLKSAIQHAYEVLNLPIPQGVKAHSARHASTSWAELKAVSVLDICQQASWATPNTFVKHYKLDLSHSVSARHAKTVLGAHAHAQ